LLGILIFSEGFDEWVVIGATIIILSISFIMWREGRVRNKTITPLSPETKL
jgi:drug/metabolite transporter (DMT)-like permease